MSGDACRRILEPVTVTPATLRLVDISAGGGPLLGASMREGRVDAARRTKLSVTGPDGLEWTVRRLLLPHAMRPYPPTELMDMSHPSHEVAAALPLGFVVLPLVLPFLPVVLLFRALRLARLDHAAADRVEVRRLALHRLGERRPLLDAGVDVGQDVAPRPRLHLPFERLRVSGYL